MGTLEIQGSRQFVVLLIEGAAGGKYLDGRRTHPALPALRQPAGAPEHVQQHLLRQLPGRSVLLARVVGADEDRQPVRRPKLAVVRKNEPSAAADRPLGLEDFQIMIECDLS